MSLILDALARAQRDKQLEQLPDQQSGPQAELVEGSPEPQADGPSPDDEEPDARPRPLLWVAGLVAAVLVVAVLGKPWLARTGGDDRAGIVNPPGPATPAVTPPDRIVAADETDPGAEMNPGGVGSATAGTSAAARAPLLDAEAGPDAGAAPPSDPAVSEAPESTQPLSEAEAAAVAALYKDAGRAVESTQASEPGSAGDPVSLEEQAADADPPAAPSDDASSPVDSTPIDVDEVLRQVAEQSAAAGLEPNPVPLLDSLPKQYRDRVPTLLYLRHDYNPAQGSTVLINGETLRPGERNRGVELREVLPDSVILSYDGTEFRLRALNSWVNL